MTTSADTLVQRWVVEDPNRPGPAGTRLATYGVEVWVLVVVLRGRNGNIDQVAKEYDIPSEAVKAARSYYKAHKAEIDARILLNTA